MQIKISLPDELVSAMDETRRDVSRSMYMRRALEFRLGRYRTPLTEPPPATIAAKELDLKSYDYAHAQVSPKLRSGIKPRPKGQ